MTQTVRAFQKTRRTITGWLAVLAIALVWASGTHSRAANFAPAGQAAVLAEIGVHLDTAVLAKPADMHRRIEARDGPVPDLAVLPGTTPALPALLRADLPRSGPAAPARSRDWQLPDTRAPPATRA